MAKSSKRYFIMWESDKYNRGMYNPETGTYGSYEDISHGRYSTIKSAKSGISRIRKEFADRNPRNFRVYDSWGEIQPDTNFVPCAYCES